MKLTKKQSTRIYEAARKLVLADRDSKPFKGLGYNLNVHVVHLDDFKLSLAWNPLFNRVSISQPKSRKVLFIAKRWATGNFNLESQNLTKSSLLKLENLLGL